MNHDELKNHLDTVYDELCKRAYELNIDSSTGKPYADQSYMKDSLDSLVFAGGCIASLLQGEEPKDYDLYFTRQHKLNEKNSGCLANFPLIKQLRADNTHHLFKSPNADTYFLNGKILQIIDIHKAAGNPDNIISSFDFVHTQNYYHPLSKKLVITDEAAILNKIIKVNPKTCSKPIASVFRLNKFLDRGYQADIQAFRDILNNVAENTDDDSVSYEDPFTRPSVAKKLEKLRFNNDLEEIINDGT